MGAPHRRIRLLYFRYPGGHWRYKASGNALNSFFLYCPPSIVWKPPWTSAAKTELWGTGDPVWAAQRCENFANDQGAETPLVAVIANSSWSQLGQGLPNWLPSDLTTPVSPQSARG
ncbi:hypothetical protein GCM10010372_83100 [Streptomyces tauricus]|nr:hypothetical protein GCM10010372_83100 [Streptomyces tauricus]